METIMINRYITAAILVTTLSCSHFANAVLIRVSDGGTVNNLALETETVWDIDDLGKLQGAFNVDVGGTLWDVVFRDGTFNSVFSEAEAATIDVRTEHEATDFAEALLASVFVDGMAPALLFDSRPDFTRGCTDANFCLVITDFAPENEDNGRIRYTTFNDRTDSDDNTFTIAEPGVLDTTNKGFLVFARWTEANLIKVPAPSTISIFALGLIGLAARRFYKQS